MGGINHQKIAWFMTLRYTKIIITINGWYKPSKMGSSLLLYHHDSPSFMFSPSNLPPGPKKGRPFPSIASGDPRVVGFRVRCGAPVDVTLGGL